MPGCAARTRDCRPAEGRGAGAATVRPRCRPAPRRQPVHVAAAAAQRHLSVAGSSRSTGHAWSAPAGSVQPDGSSRVEIDDRRPQSGVLLRGAAASPHRGACASATGGSCPRTLGAPRVSSSSRGGRRPRRVHAHARTWATAGSGQRRTPSERPAPPRRRCRRVVVRLVGQAPRSTTPAPAGSAVAQLRREPATSSRRRGRPSNAVAASIENPSTGRRRGCRRGRAAAPTRSAPTRRRRGPSHQPAPRSRGVAAGAPAAPPADSSSRRGHRGPGRPARGCAARGRRPRRPLRRRRGPARPPTNEPSGRR